MSVVAQTTATLIGRAWARATAVSCSSFAITGLEVSSNEVKTSVK
jgi:hypothetical protein